MADKASSPALRVGIVGAGVITTNLHLPVLVNHPAASVAWIADLSVERARALAEAVGARVFAPELMAEIDVVLLAIPLPGRSDWLSDAAAAGAAVLVEKPFANDRASHLDILGRFCEHELAAGYQRRFYATGRFLAAAVRERWFGPLRRIVTREGGRVASGGPANFEDAPVAEGGGMLKNLGCHGIDLALHVTGATNAEVVSARFEMDGAVDREAHGIVALTGPDLDCELDCMVSQVNDQSNSAEYQFEQAAVTIAVAPARQVTLTGRSGGRTIVGIDAEAGAGAGAWTSAQATHLMWDDFLRQLPRGAPAVNSGQSALLTTEVMAAMFERGA